MTDITCSTVAMPTPVEVQRSAYNAAFYELGLRWHWDADIYHAPIPREEERAHIRRYIEDHQPHLLTAYDVDFLVDAIQAAKDRRVELILACGRHDACMVDWAEVHKHEIGI